MVAQDENNLSDRLIPKTSKISMICWNIEGLASRLTEPGFITSIDFYHISCFLETFTGDTFDFSTYFDEYLVFHTPAIRSSHDGRRSGGVVMLIKNCLANYITQLPTNHNNLLAARLYFAGFFDVILICVYIPPVDSPYYKDKDVKCNIQLLEDEILRLQIAFPNSTFMICGDFNARTGNSNVHDVDNVEEMEQIQTSECTCYHGLKARNSQDNTTNLFGQILLNLCQIYHLCILNGSVESDALGRYTYLSHHGSSVVDYCLYAAGQLDCDIQLSVGGEIFSNHMPLKITLQFGKDREDKPAVKKTVSKLVWDESKIEEVKAKVAEPEFRRSIGQACEMIDVSEDTALSVFTSTLNSASSCMRKSFKVGGTKATSRAEWFDEECRKAKRDARRTLNKFRKTNAQIDKDEYIKSRNSYKTIIRDKKKESCRKLNNSLAKNIRNSASFRALINNARRNKRYNVGISVDIWRDHFRKVFNTDLEPVSRPELDSNEFILTDVELDAPIHPSEVDLAVHCLRAGKSVGLDEIPGEYLKMIYNYIRPFLTKMFHTLYERQSFPQEWSRSLIVPIFKAGNRHDPQNYRGISLLNIVSKLFTSILTRRLQQWAEDNGKICVEQAGFRAEHSTIDHIFTLYAMILKNVYGGGRGKLYIAFIDYQRAFDSVNRSCLWSVLQKIGVSTKLIKMLQAMYSHVEACVRWDSVLSEFFDCPAGVRQGAKESPIIFSFLMSVIADYVRERGRHGVQLLQDKPEIYSLIFADDVALVSTTAVGLQTQLDSLDSISTQLGLTINRKKSKIMVFRRGGFLSRGERWTLGGDSLEVVSKYKYLGYFFTSRLSDTAMLENQNVKAKQRTVSLVQFLFRTRNFNSSVFFHLFDAQILPVLMYGAELWGIGRHDPVEKAHMFACKHFMNLATRTPNCFIYGELGRYPLYINAALRAVKYWLKLCRMPLDRLPKQAYLMLTNMNVKGRVNWTNSVKQFLFQLGFGYVWNDCGTRNENAFLKSLKVRLRDCFQQEWHGRLSNSERFFTYRSFKKSFETEQYINDLKIKKFRDVFIRFRLGVNELNANKWYEQNQSSNCPFCVNTIENEKHFLIDCPLYKDIRQKFLKSYLNDVERRSIGYLLDGRNVFKTRNVSMFIYYALKMRHENICT